MEKSGWTVAQCGYGERYHHRLCQEGQVSADQRGKFHGCTCAGLSCLWSLQRTSLTFSMQILSVTSFKLKHTGFLGRQVPGRRTVPRAELWGIIQVHVTRSITHKVSWNKGQFGTRSIPTTCLQTLWQMLWPRWRRNVCCQT